MNNNVIKIVIGKIYEVEPILKNYGASRRFLYIAGLYVDYLCGKISKELVGDMKIIKKKF